MATYPTSKPVLTSPTEDWRNKVPVPKEEVKETTKKKGGSLVGKLLGREKSEGEEEEHKVEKAEKHIKKCVKCDEAPEKVTSSKETMYSCMTESCSAYNSWVNEKEWQKKNKKADDADEEIEESQ